MLEYQEIIGKKANGIVAENIIKLLLSLPNVLLIEAYYHWHLVTTDPDDNAFVDAAIAGNADYIVTEDHHFHILKSIEFPVVNILNIQEFKDMTLS